MAGSLSESKTKATSPRKFVAEHVTITSPQCLGCEHLEKPGKLFCKAFPKGIPMKIYVNEVMHNKPYEDDHGIQFTAKAAKT